MIRINLLSQKRRSQRKEGSQAWLAAVLVGVLFEIVLFFVFHGMKVEELDAQKRKNREISAQIEQVKKSVAQHAAVKEQLAELRAREEAIQKLQAARTGPTAVLLELSRILTPGRGPSVDPDRLMQIQRDNPLAAITPGWDPRRLWILSFQEEKRRVRIAGLARDGEDVSELARRMSLSDYFADVRLLPARRDVDPETKLELVRFSLEAGVKY
ncbi:MAG TPA: PilN domain-containing protein [Polyangiaceae bacterium]|nr:PilN domain-containing protein [Polyangiaceae bacterium]